MKLNAAAALFPVYAIAFWALPVVAVYAANMYGVFPLILGTAALGLTAATLKKDTLKIFDRQAALWLAGILLLGLCSLLWAIEPGRGAEKLVKAVFIYLSGFALYSCATQVPEEKRDALGKGAAIAFAFATFVCAAELFLKYPLYRIIKHKPPDMLLPKSIFNQTTVVLALMIWGLVPWLWRNGLKYAFPAAWAFLLWLIVFHGESQTASAALFIGGGVFFIAHFAPRSCFYLLAFLVPAGIMLSPWLTQIVFDAFNAAESDKAWNVLGKRLDIWDAVARRALESPFYGHGIEAAKHITDFDFSGRHYDKHEILHPHNNVLQFWLEFGVIGAMALSAFLVFVLQRLRRLQGIGYASSMGLFAACLTVSAVGHGFWQTWWPGLLFVMAAMTRMLLRGPHATRA